VGLADGVGIDNGIVVVTEQRVLAVWNHDGIPLCLESADRYAPFEDDLAFGVPFEPVDGITAPTRLSARLTARAALHANVVRRAGSWRKSKNCSDGCTLETLVCDRRGTDDRRAGSRRAIGRSSSASWTRCRHPAAAGRAASRDLAGRQADGDRVVVVVEIFTST
jgi:hypothetical protein